jgi:DNA polymerase-3 subunit beta
MFVEMTPEGLNFVATDGNKLVKYSRKDLISEEPSSFVLPRKALNVLKSSLSDAENDVEILYNKTMPCSALAILLLFAA